MSYSCYIWATGVHALESTFFMHQALSKSVALGKWSCTAAVRWNQVGNIIFVVQFHPLCTTIKALPQNLACPWEYEQPGKVEAKQWCPYSHACWFCGRQAFLAQICMRGRTWQYMVHYLNNKKTLFCYAACVWHSCLKIWVSGHNSSVQCHGSSLTALFSLKRQMTVTARQVDWSQGDWSGSLILA